MWLITPAQIEPLLRVADQLVREALNWAWTNHRPGAQHSSLIDAAKQAPGALGRVARKTKLKILMAKLATSQYLPEIKADYERIARDYRNFLETGAERRLNGAARKEAEKIFKSLYHHILDSGTFWESYAKRTPPLSKQALRSNFGKLRKACPYCDFNMTSSPPLTSTDHFLAQTHFPVLAIYWENLIVSCHACNEQIKGAAFIGTDNGVPSFIPILHPLYHQPADHLRFEFSDNWRPIGPKVITLDPVAAQATKNYCRLFRIEELYGGLAETMAREVNLFLDHVKRDFRRRYRPGRNRRVLLARIAKVEAGRTLYLLRRNRGLEDRTKVRNDLYTYLTSDVDLVARLTEIAL